MELTTTKPELAIIKSKIYEIRGVKVMLDFDLAEAYGVETKRLNEQVKRNIERFPCGKVSFSSFCTFNTETQRTQRDTDIFFVNFLLSYSLTLLLSYSLTLLWSYGLMVL